MSQEDEIVIPCYIKENRYKEVLEQYSQYWSFEHLFLY